MDIYLATFNANLLSVTIKYQRSVMAIDKISLYYLSVCACVRESGRSREAIRPVLKKLPFLWIARVGRYTKEPTDTTSNGTGTGLKEGLCNSSGRKLDQEVSYVWRPGYGERAQFGSRGCPRVLDRGRQFYSKSLLLGALASDSARQLTSFFG